MDYLKLPKLNLSVITIAIVLGVAAAVLVYFIQSKGLIPVTGDKLQNPATTETQTVIQEENAVIAAVESASSSVVTISVVQKVPDINNVPGTGFVFSAQGIIVTNKHTVPDPNLHYTVATRDGKKYEIKKIFQDPVLDLAVVQIDGLDTQPLKIGDSAVLRLGQTAIAIGNTLGKFANMVTTGTISGLDDLIQTDAVINQGTSGGPLLNSAGQVIGVSLAPKEGTQGIGSAVPINLVKKIVNEFIQKDLAGKPFLGIKYKFITEGADVSEVIDGSPAQKAGIKIGDIITKVEDQAVASEMTISQIIAGKKIGDSLKLTLWNNGKERQIVTILQELPSQ